MNRDLICRKLNFLHCEKKLLTSNHIRSVQVLRLDTAKCASWSNLLRLTIFFDSNENILNKGIDSFELTLLFLILLNKFFLIKLSGNRLTLQASNYFLLAQTKLVSLKKKFVKFLGSLTAVPYFLQCTKS